MTTTTDKARHPFARELLGSLSQSSGVLIALSLTQFQDAAAQAQHLAGNGALAAELIATAQLLHGLGAQEARDQLLVLTAIVLEDDTLNAALCRKLHGRKTDAAKLIGSCPMSATAATQEPRDPSKSALATRIAATNEENELTKPRRL